MPPMSSLENLSRLESPKSHPALAILYSQASLHRMSRGSWGCLQTRRQISFFRQPNSPDLWGRASRPSSHCGMLLLRMEGDSNLLALAVSTSGRRSGGSMSAVAPTSFPETNDG